MELLQNLWNGILQLMSLFVIPDWGSLIALLPVFVTILVIVFFVWALVMYRRTGRRRRRPGRIAPAPPAGVHMPGPTYASFAGQQETFLNVAGIDGVLARMREVFASLYNDRAISYRVHKGYAHGDVALSAGVQRMVRSDVGAAGVMFTIDTESGFPDVVVISAAWGLGETVVQGTINPDKYVVFKPLLAVPGSEPVI